MVYTIRRVIYNDKQYNYQHIITIDRKPEGPLAKYVKLLHIPVQQISAFRLRSENNECIFAFYNINNGELITINNLATLFTIFQDNGYRVETELTNMVNNQKSTTEVICYISFIS